MNTSKTVWAGTLTFPAGSELSNWIELTLVPHAPLGTYKLEIIAEYKGVDIASGHFDVEVVE